MKTKSDRVRDPLRRLPQNVEAFSNLESAPKLLPCGDKDFFIDSNDTDGLAFGMECWRLIICIILTQGDVGSPPSSYRKRPNADRKTIAPQIESLAAKIPARSLVISYRKPTAGFKAKEGNIDVPADQWLYRMRRMSE
jgi:hypothetical protein